MKFTLSAKQVSEQAAYAIGLIDAERVKEARRLALNQLSRRSFWQWLRCGSAPQPSEEAIVTWMAKHKPLLYTDQRQRLCAVQRCLGMGITIDPHLASRLIECDDADLRTLAYYNEEDV